MDNRIDETARQLTAGEPGGDLRARVLARIDATTSPAEAGHHVLPSVVSGFSRTWWIAAPVALAAALVIAIVATRTHREIPPMQEAQQVHAATQVQPVLGAQTIHDVQILEVRAVRPQAVQVQAAQESQEIPEVSPFAPATIDIAPLTIDAIPPAQSIVVEEVTVSPIEVRALDAPDALAQ